MAVSVRTCTSFFSAFSRSLCATPKCCSSSTITRPKRLNSTLFARIACVPMTMSIWPSARPALVSLRFGCRDQPRQSSNVDREAVEALDEVRIVLAREQELSGRPAQLACPTSPARTLRAARPPSCRSRRRRKRAGPSACPPEVSQDVADRAILVICLLIREAVHEFRVAGIGLGDDFGARRARAATLMSSPAISRIRSFIRALRALPCLAAEAVERNALALVP